MESILDRPGTQWAVTRFTKEREARRVGNGRLDDQGSDVEAIDLGPMLANGLLELVDVDGDLEAATYIRFAQDLDDGEAQCGAIALGRGLTLATDDAKAVRVFSAGVPPIPTVGTPAILRAWSLRGPQERDVVRNVLLDIERRARFRPRLTDPLAGWWAETAA
jgi:hypothetical protein